MENLFSACTAWTAWRVPLSTPHQLLTAGSSGGRDGRISAQVCLFSFFLCTQCWPEAGRCSSHTVIVRDRRRTADELRMARARRERASVGPWQSPWTTALALDYIWMFCNETQIKPYQFQLLWVRLHVICTGNTFLTKPMLHLGWERATVEIIHLYHNETENQMYLSIVDKTVGWVFQKHSFLSSEYLPGGNLSCRKQIRGIVKAWRFCWWRRREHYGNSIDIQISISNIQYW